ncbi:metal-dependent hydrolase [Bacillus phage W.Ph.]|uniref:Gp151 n=1 Tax=Bacillus phage W.Ph. TaxID=764595 RepID=G9B1Q2_9CAUD|nr:metal-dependent hydrolase [Bacillus phage W.Ph.]ADH03297.1 gp151 [Bacillus phage W.Ph.]
MLKFIGRGSAFNTKEGTNAAYFVWDGELIIIDCGTEVFKRLKESGLLQQFTDIRVIVTHLHDDHAGSLSSLILYNYFCMGNQTEKNIIVYSPYDIKLKDFLDRTGCTTKYYRPRNFDNHITMDFTEPEDSIELSAVPQRHVEELLSYGYIFDFKGQSIYYSGDTNMLHEFVKKPSIINKFTRIYQDTCWLHYEGNVHLSLTKLVEAVPDRELRSRIYCMHLDEGMLSHEGTVRNLGFKVVEVDQVFK